MVRYFKENLHRKHISHTLYCYFKEFPHYQILINFLKSFVHQIKFRSTYKKKLFKVFLSQILFLMCFML